MRFSFHGQADQQPFGWFADGLRRTFEAHGHSFVDTGDASLVINFFPEGSPRWFRRNGQAVFVTGVTRIDGPFDRPLERAYPLLVRSLSNLLVAIVGEEPGAETHFVTPEQGHYVVANGGRNGDASGFFEQVYERMLPLASSTLVVDNIFEPDLPQNLWQGDEASASICRAGARLQKLELLPAPYPIADVLPPDVLRHLRRLFGIGGLSYGNLSARCDHAGFWMSASGVDKSRLREIGRDVLLVTGYDAAKGAMVLSVPPNVEPRRVSVDAIEHWMIYREHPSVEAILHVHGWMDGVPSTAFNYPCGTYELAKAVADMVREADDPSCAVVGLKNHGLTVTGRSLDEIFERTEGKILRHVPMT